MTPKSEQSAAILAILLETKQAGVGKVTRTALIKYLYLLDLWFAEESGGATFTKAEWKFHHFGPYADALASALDFLSTQPAVEHEDRDRTDKSYSLYWLGAAAQVKPLEALVPQDVRIRLEVAVRRFANDLSSLLSYVYFETEPMRNARPGDLLSFTGLRKLNFKSDIKLVKVPIADTKKAARIKDLFARVGEQWKRDHTGTGLSSAPIRDVLFAETIEDTGVSEGAGEYCARLSFDGEGR